MKIRWYILTAVLACGVGLLHSRILPQEHSTEPRNGTDSVPIGGPFNLVDHRGQTRSSDDFQGKHMLLYFGYTFCPDICPTALLRMSSSLKELEEKHPKAAQSIQPIFITLDPDRDTQSTLAQYVDFFHSRLIGLTGSEQQIHDVAEKYLIYYKRQEANSSNGYLVDHSSVIYLMNTEGKYITHFTHDTTSQEMTDALIKAATTSDKNTT